MARKCGFTSWFDFGMFWGFIVCPLVVSFLSVFVRPRTPTPAERYGLPDGAAEIRDLGRGWLTFVVEVGGRRRRFVYHEGTGVLRTESLVDAGEDAP